MTPDEYVNDGPMKPIVAIALLLLSFILVVLQFHHQIDIGYYLAAAPMAYVMARRSLFTLLVNSFHYALQIDSVDQMRNDMHTREENTRMASTLDVDTFLASVRADDEKVGRA